MTGTIRKSFIFLSVILLGVLSGHPATAQGKYNNPILHSDYSDPDVECVDGEYWMTASSFNCVPGLQILHSSNLLDWETVGAALPVDSPYWDGAVASPDHGNAVMAPAIRFRESDRRFYIFWGDPDRGVFQVSAEDPRGRWTDPVCVIPGKGLLDPCPLFDTDGRVYLVHAWAGSRAGFNSVLNVCELDADCTHSIGEQVLVFDGNKNGNLTVEGPKFYKHDGRYWIFAPAGGVQNGWQLVLRADTPYGPYEWKRALEAASKPDAEAGRAAPTHGPHQGGWVADAAGQYWFLHFEDRYAWGRVVHLQPMKWTSDGWCLIGNDVDGDGIGEPVSTWDRPVPFVKKKDAPVTQGGVDATETRTGFTGPSIPLNWQWHGRPGIEWAMPNPSEGCLRLNCLKQASGWRNLWNTPNLLLEKIIGPSMELTVKLVFRPSYEGDRAGMTVMGMDYSTLEMVYNEGKVYLQRRLCSHADAGGEEQILESIPLDIVRSKANRPYCTVWVRASIKERGAAWPPAVGCDFSYSLDGSSFVSFGPEFKAREGKWIGAKIGFFALASIKRNEGGSVEIY